MVTLFTDQTQQIYEGLSTDPKPVDVQNGSRFLEIDTSDLYLFDTEQQSWNRYNPPTPPINIIQQPVNLYGQTIGELVEFHVVATGDGLTYRWRSLVDGQWSNTNFSGSTTPDLRISLTAARVGRLYRCRITDANGNVRYSGSAAAYI